MKPAAARLLLFSNANAFKRAMGIVAGVALGMGMLLILLGTYLHIPDRDHRAAWQLSTGPHREFADNALVPIEKADDIVLVSTRTGYFESLTLEIARVASTTHTSVDFPASLTPPQPGEYYASPAMERLIEAHPRDELGDRYGTYLGELPSSMLRGPSQRIVLMGADWQSLSADSNATAEKRFGGANDGGRSFLYRSVIAVGSVAILVPIILLIAIVSQLGAAERRERLATVRLIGAGRRGVAALAGLEMGVASLAGGLAGIGVAAALRPVAARLSINGTTSFSGDLVPSTAWTMASILAITFLGAGTAWWRTFSDDVGALGATRERPEKSTKARRVLPLAIGLAMFAASAFSTRITDMPEAPALLGLVLGFGLIAFGIVFAGSWITMVSSQLYRRFARSASGVVAAGRLSRHPRATFRSVAGVVIAVFVVSVFSGAVSSVETSIEAPDVPGLLSKDAVLGYVDNAGQADAMVAAVRGIDGVSTVAVAYQGEGDLLGKQVMSAADARAVGATAVPDSPFVALSVFDMLAGDSFSGGDGIANPVPADGIEGLGADDVIVVTDGKAATVERVRTALLLAGGQNLSPTTRIDFMEAGTLESTRELSVLAYVGMAIAIGISALALTVATVSAAMDRKRTFGLLRLGGMPVRELRRSVTTEVALPLGVTLFSAAGLGFLVAWILIRALGQGETMSWPDATYWYAIAGSVALAVVAVASSFGMVRRSTELTATRFE